MDRGVDAAGGVGLDLAQVGVVDLVLSHRAELAESVDDLLGSVGGRAADVGKLRVLHGVDELADSLRGEVLDEGGLVRGAPLGHLGQRGGGEAGVQLGLAELAVLKGDRHLADVEAQLVHLVRNLNLEDVALGGQRIQVQLLQHFALEGAVACGHVRHVGAEGDGDVLVAQLGQQEAVLRPVDHFPALDVAGTDGQICAVIQRVEKPVQFLRRVGAVGIHLHQHLVVALQAPVEAGAVGGQQAVLAGAVQHVDLVVGGGELVGLRAGAVRRVVVHDEDVHGILRSQHALDDKREVLHLVVGRNDHQSLVGHGANSPRIYAVVLR